jgi:hypothetical protein
MLLDLLDRWGAGLTASAAERRMAIRLARQHPLLDLSDDGDEQTTADLSAEVSALPAVRRVAALSAGPPLDTSAGADLAGDDDEADRDPLDPDDDTDTGVGPGLADFYDDVMDSE